MTKININGHDHQVEIQTEPSDETQLADVVDAARRLWHDTVQAEPRPGPASAGFAAERSHGGIGYDWRMGEAEPTPVQATHLEAGRRG